LKVEKDSWGLGVGFGFRVGVGVGVAVAFAAGAKVLSGTDVAVEEFDRS
jgi:hypothetical protein